jgi:general secretion pathway protein C
MSSLSLTPRQARTALDVLTGLVVISIAFALAGLTWRLAGHAGTGAITVPSGRSGPAVAPDIAPAIALAPFG